MAWETIRKNKATVAATARLADYDEACRSLRRRDARAGLDGLLIDDPASGPPPDTLSLTRLMAAAATAACCGLRSKIPIRC